MISITEQTIRDAVIGSIVAGGKVTNVTGRRNEDGTFERSITVDLGDGHVGVFSTSVSVDLGDGHVGVFSTSVSVDSQDENINLLDYQNKIHAGVFPKPINWHGKGTALYALQMLSDRLDSLRRELVVAKTLLGKPNVVVTCPGKRELDCCIDSDAIRPAMVNRMQHLRLAASGELKAALDAGMIGQTAYDAIFHQDFAVE